jgi:hypothetical protein
VIYFLILTANGFYFFLNQKSRISKYGVSCILVTFFILQLPINLQYYTIKPRNTWIPAQSDVRNALETIIEFEHAKQARGYINRETVSIRADNHAYFPTQFYLTQHPDSVGYSKALRELNMKYSYVLSGVEAFQPENIPSIMDKLRYLAGRPGIFWGVGWYVIGNPQAIAEIEPLLDAMPERIIYRKKFSYGSLVFLLRT